MYTRLQRQSIFNQLVESLKSNELVDGVIHLGSGVFGYNDHLSDIDMMLSCSEEKNIEKLKETLINYINNFGVYFFKDIKRDNNVSILIFVLNNQLELNISIVPRDKLTVRSRNWCILYDRNGLVSKKMNEEVEVFNNGAKIFDNDYAYVFSYYVRKIKVELFRNNFVLVHSYLQVLRDYIVDLQTSNEGIISTQFKSYDKLNNTFTDLLLKTFPMSTSHEEINECLFRLIELFKSIYKKEDIDFSIFNNLMLMNESLEE